MDQSQFFVGPAGEPVPEVNPVDVRAVWKLAQETIKNHPGMHVGIGAEAYERICSPGANIPAVWFRTALIAGLEQMSEIVIPRTSDGEPTASVFRAAAEVPMEWIGSEEREGLPFDIEDFIRRVSDA